MNRKFITLILVLFVLIALPLVSLYYSFQGKAFRKQAMAELQSKGTIPDSVKNLINPGFNLYLLTGNCRDTLILKPLIEQFKDEKVSFGFIGDSSYYADLKWNKSASLKSAGIIQWIKAPPLKSSDPGTCKFLLTNKQFEILHTYDLAQDTNRTKIIEHIALLVTKKQ